MIYAVVTCLNHFMVLVLKILSAQTINTYCNKHVQSLNKCMMQIHKY